MFCETRPEGPDLKPKRSDREGDKHTNGVTNKYGSPPVFKRSPSLVGLLTKKIDVSSKERKKKEKRNRRKE